MVSGLLMELDDHNCWTIAEAAGHRGPHRLQHLLSRAVWDEQQVLDIAADWAARHLDDGDAVLIVDETADEKSSAAAFILSFAVAHGCDLGFCVADNDLDVAVAALWGSD
jgi:SRSO17 transposase